MLSGMGIKSFVATRCLNVRHAVQKTRCQLASSLELTKPRGPNGDTADPTISAYNFIINVTSRSWGVVISVQSGGESSFAGQDKNGGKYIVGPEQARIPQILS